MQQERQREKERKKRTRFNAISDRGEFGHEWWCCVAIEMMWLDVYYDRKQMNRKNEEKKKRMRVRARSRPTNARAKHKKKDH